MSAVTFCPFELLFDQQHTNVLLNIFLRLDPPDFDRCLRVCRSWRAFVARHIVDDLAVRARLLRHKLPHEWLEGEPKVRRVDISRTLAPPLSVYADDREVVLTTVDSMLVWERGMMGMGFRGEYGPEIKGSNHVMIKSVSLNDQIAVTIHKHNSLVLVWSRGHGSIGYNNNNNVGYKIIQEIPCLGMEGQESPPMFVKVLEDTVVTWLEDGSVVVYGIYKDGTLRRKFVLNGHIQGHSDAAIDGHTLLTASPDSKVNLWDLRKGKLLWSNRRRTEAHYKTARLNSTLAVVGGSYGVDGYLQWYDRATGEALHDMVTMEGSGIDSVAAGEGKVVAVVHVRHKLLTSKVMVLNADNGDLIAEQCFVDVLALHLVQDRVLVLLNNQVGDFRTRISAYDLSAHGRAFEEERLVYQYQHNHYRLPIRLDDTSVIHTSEEKAEIFVREFDSFFKQFERGRRLNCSGNGNGGAVNGNRTMEKHRGDGSQWSLCQRLRKLLIRKMGDKCVIM